MHDGATRATSSLAGLAVANKSLDEVPARGHVYSE